MTRPWLVTGAAGFVGHHTVRWLVESGCRVVGVDNLNDYYDPTLKKDRLAQLEGVDGFQFEFGDIADGARVEQLFRAVRPSVVIHLAAQAGVRYSLERPDLYVDTNLVGFANILEACRRHDVDHLVYASSSSVYGSNSRLPYSVHDPTGHPVSLYAATKRANELMAHAYSHLYSLPTTGLRFFTVYGPWGRPDMAYFKFADALRCGRPVTIHGDGSAQRDFTYVDDVVGAVVALAERPAMPDPHWSVDRLDPSSSRAPFRLFNVGHGCQATVEELLVLLEDLLGRKARRHYGPSQPGDVTATHADTSDLMGYLGFGPSVSLESGLAAFTSWYRDYYALS